ncbi:MFS transporter [Streptomyces sp. H27-H5]|uniref:MFS transporter n=1 Tax=Streptomyces sp. H27-H5 TaxID=2996460 RepID=UPI0022701B77|nr:MFS transporter [Streptomyces sp. H27-H5]MCY0960251.1 hypothetical protein [Streptomyces sp. H27-H5]
MYRSLVVLAAAMFAIGTDSFVIAGILPDSADSLDVSVGTAGWLLTAYALTYAVLGPVMAALTGHMTPVTRHVTRRPVTTARPAPRAPTRLALNTATTVATWAS